MYRPGPRHYRPGHDCGARCLWPRLCPVSPGRELCLRWWGWWWPLDPDPARSPGQLPSSVCCTGSTGPGLRNSSVSHSPLARPATSDTACDPSPATQSRSAQREIESHSNPLSASSQIWHPPVLRLRRLSIQCVLITEESVRHWLVPSVTGPLVTDCDMWDCEPCDHQHQPRLTL